MRLSGLTATGVWNAPTRTLTAGAGGSGGDFSSTTATATPQTNATVNVFGAYVQLVAALAHSVQHFCVMPVCSVATDAILVAIATGGVGVETDVYSFVCGAQAFSVPMVFNFTLDLSVLPKGARVSLRAKNLTANAADNMTCNCTLGLAND